MTKTFNPFREALPFLITPIGFHRGEFPQHADAKTDEFMAMDEVVKRGRDIDERAIARKANLCLVASLGQHRTMEEWLKAHIPGVNIDDKDDMQVRRFILLVELANDYDNGSIVFTL